MTITLTEEQTALRDAVRAFMEGEAPLALVRKVFEGGAFDEEALRAGCSTLGLRDLFIADGGGTIRELGLIASEVGRALFPLPLVEELYAVYLAEHTVEAPWRGADRVCLVGTSSTAVRGAAGATTAILFGQHKQLNVVTLTPEMKRVGSYLDRTMPAGDLQIPAQGHQRIAWSGTLDPLAGLQLLAAAELSGIATRVVELTVGFVQTRRQFDVPVGGLQAVQHQLADMHLQAEAVRTLTEFALWAAEASPEQHQFSALSAVRLATEEVPRIVETAIQLHGGIGFTWEYDLHLYLRRACMLEATHRPTQAAADALLAAAGRQ